MPHLLKPLGFDDVDSAVYDALLTTSRSEPSALADSLGMPEGEVSGSLARLVSHGLANRLLFDTETYMAVSPEVALPVLIQRRRCELTDLQAAADRLSAERQRASSTADLPVVQAVEGEEAVIDAITQIQGEATEELLIVDAPPYVPGVAHPNDAEFAKLAEGVAYRVVYHPGGLASGAASDHMRRCVAAGEQARLHTDAGPKLVVADRRIALVVASADDPDPVSRLLVRPSAMLDLVIERFESLWARATPLGPDPAAGGPGEVDDRDHELLSLLAAGLPDRVIARSWGVTERTVGRRVTALMRRLDADSRFSAGVRAAQRGWI